MKTNKPHAMQLISVLLCAMFLLALCSCQSNGRPHPDGIFASADSFEEPLPSPEALGLTENTLKNHHYHQLTEEEQILYIAILNSWANGKDSLTVNNVDYYLLNKHISHVIDAVYYDHPECFLYTKSSNLKGSVPLGVNDDTAIITWEKNTFKKISPEEESMFNNTVSEILSVASVGTDDYERVKLVHDYLVNHITYDYSALSDNGELIGWRNNAYSALAEGSAVCGGYARAFQLILNRLGIPCTTISGRGENEPHAWSLAMLDGEYYLFDLTWNDHESTLSYNYFAVTTKELKKTHTFDKEFAYPTCTATACNYFVKEDLLIEKYSFDEVDRMISNQNTGADTAVLKFTSKAEFKRAVKDLITNENWIKLAAFKDSRRIRYIKDEDHLILTVYFSTDH